MPIMPGHVEYLLQALFDHCINKDPRQGVSANHMDSAAVKQYCDRYSYVSTCVKLALCLFVPYIANLVGV